MSSSVISVGFDFGTTRSKAAIVDQTEKPSSVQNTRGDFWTPSVICFENGVPSFVGLEAQYEGLVRPEKVAANFKLKLGSDDVLFKGKQDYAATDLAAVMLGALKADVERRTSTVVDQAMLSCPANFRDDSRQALLDAAKKAGFEPLGLIPEPSAAGLAYVYADMRDQKVAVFDLGGGTLDVSIIEVAGNSITVRSTNGVAQLGGNDFTARIEKQVFDRFVKETGYTPTHDADPLFFQELYQKAEAAKVALTERDKTTLVLGCRGKQAILEIKREDFVSWCEDLFQKCLDCTNKAIQGAGSTWNDMDRLIMVGGASRMPYIQNRLADMTGLVPKMDLEPDRVVALGTALKARLILGEKGVLPHPNIFVREVTSHGLGCAVLKSGGKGEDDLIQNVIVPKNTPIPVQHTDHYFLEHESQDTVIAVIAQGDEGKPIKDCLKIGELVMDNLPKEVKRSKRIKVDFCIDANGIACVTATDLVGGSSKSVSVDCKQGIQTK